MFTATGYVAVVALHSCVFVCVFTCMFVCDPP
jgi:hypothetical protein